MRRTLQLTICLLLACAAAHAQTRPAKVPAPLARSRQLIVVTTPDWNSVQGTLRHYERAGGEWRQVGDSFAVVVGRSGLGWGEGVVRLPEGSPVKKGLEDAPFKKEGDGRAPAGVFRLGPAFGFDGSDEAGWVRLPYRPLKPSTECVDDTASTHYNLIVDRGTTKPADWNSSERMREVEGYRWGLVVLHNSAPRTAGRGSCIFLHIWASPERGTAGCTAMERANLEALLRWLDPRRRPLLVQLPESEYARLQAPWRLPAAAGGR
ncbi:MAG TPA: L,D-transpeptidase family protein [Pyrinomonadaceae bacterium]|nr:L,D-transpeptidase family protein [Pyrinomonadaceae bacterium]